MVRSKEVPKKPKDPLLTPPSKPRGFSFRDDGGGGLGGSLPRNRGGAAMSSPAPASVPNYMRGTSSSGAKAGQRQHAGAPSSASASTPTRQRRPVRVTPRGKVLFPAPAAASAAASPGMVRPTCSSTLKEAKFPGALDLAPGATDAEGPAAMRVCPYTYCSLNGHAHAPAVPLRSFLAKQRRLIKTQQSMKHKGVSAFHKGHQRPEGKNSGGAVVRAGDVAKVAPPLVNEEALLGDFFVEVYTGPRVSSGTSCSDMSLDEMDATVRRMEFVVFDRCGADDDDGKGTNDIGTHGDGEGMPEERPGVCGDSSSDCSDAGISGNIVEELPWMRYECDSLDCDVSEEQGEQIGEADVFSQQQEGEDEEGKSCGLGDEREEEAVEEQKPEDEEIISDSPCQTEIVAEEEGVDCRFDTMYQHEASTGEETQDPGDDEVCVSDGDHKMEIAAERTCVVFTAEVCKEQEEDEDNSLGKVCQGDTSDGQWTFEEKLSESEIPNKYEGTERVEDVLENCKEKSSADQEAKDDETNMDSAHRFEITEKQKDGESEKEISETIPDVAWEEDFCEPEATSRSVSEGERSESSAVGSPDVVISNQSTSGGFEHEVKTVENAFGQLETTAEDRVSGTEDVPTRKSEDASEESGITQESSQDFDSVCVDAPAKMEPETTEREPEDSSEQSGIPQDSSQSDNSADVNVVAQIEVCVDAPAKMEPETTEGEPEDSSEQSGIPQDSNQSDNSAGVNVVAQIEVCVDAPAQMEPEITECKLEESSEESGIPQESANLNNGAETELELFTCKSKDPSEECGIAQDDLGGGAQMQLGNVLSELEDTSEESGIAKEIGEEDNSAYISDDAQNGSEITTYELDDASESVLVQEADQDHKCTDVSAGAQNGSELIAPSEPANASEESDVIQEAVPDGNTADVNDGPGREPETMACEPEHAHEELDITQEGDVDDYAACVPTGALKETQITACETKDACEEDCITEEANLSSTVQIPEKDYELSATDGQGESQNLPEDNDAKEFSVDDMCNVFSGMNLKGDVYVDPTESEISPRKRLIIAGRRRTPEEEEYMRGFNPRGPNFLPLELDPDSEKVDLKHQTAEDRKNAEEWMIDYALRRAVNNLGGRKKKVELLVQAFETVLPHDEDEKKTTPTRHVQACN